MTTIRRGQRLNLTWYALLGSGITLFTNNLYSEGFRNPPPGTFNLGRAGGRVAQVDDSSAVHQNPANLVDLTSAEAQFTPTLVYFAADFDSPAGQSSSTEGPWKPLPNAFFALPLPEKDVAFGLGITTPYGIGNKWDQDSSAFGPTGVLRYQSPYFAELVTINMNPSVAFKLSENFSFGAGLDLMWSQLTLKQMYPWLIFPGSTGTEPDGHIRAKGTGMGYGGNAGITWKITERQRLALTYRSPMDVDYTGDFSIDNITPTAAFIGARPNSSFGTQIAYPTVMAAGYGIQLSEAVRIEADLEWVQFSRFQSLDLDTGKNALLLPSSKINQQWHDTFTAGFGGDWKFAPNWVFRAGYQFYQSPVPDKTFSTTIPDADQNVITVGLGWKYKHHSVEGAYGADFYDSRQIEHNQNPALNGKYEITVHLFSFAYRYSF